jgi:predicted  nucleic acid-binding Zn-ribbon protein
LETIEKKELPDLREKLQSIANQLNALNVDTAFDIRRLNEKFKVMHMRQTKTEQNITELSSWKIDAEKRIGDLEQTQPVSTSYLPFF